jgi:RND superfamily putative drug exporter
MASRLYAWATWVVRRRGWVVTAWLLLLALVGGLGITMHGKISNSFSVPGIESQRAQDLLREKFPAAAGGVVRIVVEAPKGTHLTDPAEAQALSRGLQEAAQVPGVVNVMTPATTGALSADRSIAYADVRFAQVAENVPQSAKDALSVAMHPAQQAGIQVELGGNAMNPQTKAGGPAELAGVVIAFAVLAVALGSLVAAGLSLVTAVVGVAIGVLAVEFVSRFVEMTGTATVLALMIGLAVGIDYALFIISRHREQLAEPGTEVKDSVARATATAGSAVVFAGGTVVIALAALSAVGIPFLTVMGLGAAATVLVAVLVAISLVPAVLGLLGERLRPRRGATQAGPVRKPGRKPARKSARAERAPGAWSLAWARTVTRAPIAVLLMGVLGLVALALPARHLRLGLPSYASQPTASTQHHSYDLLSKGFGPGFNATVVAVVDTGRIPAAQRAAAVTDLRDTFRADPDVTAVSPAVPNPDGSLEVFSVVPKSGPSDRATTDLVHRLRAQAPNVAHTGATLYITGQTATEIDVSAKLSAALPFFVGIIVLLALTLLTIAFRSLLVPLKAVVGFLLSIAASLGAAVWVFQDGHLNGLLSIPSAGPITSFLPVLLIGVLFGLAMDYEVFLVSRMREHHEHNGDPTDAVIHGVERSGRVVTAAALIMIAVFGGFIFNDDPIIKSVGFALAFGVLIDAFVVRMTLVPAAMVLLGRRAWSLPRRLARVIPNVDIEGANLPSAGTPEPDPQLVLTGDGKGA